jgi:hypothetical protein
MKRSQIIYEEKSELIAKFSHPRAKEYLNYDARIRIKDSGKTPVEMILKFNGTLPFLAPMPPNEHSFKAASIVELYSKIGKWFRKHGYELI